MERILPFYFTDTIARWKDKHPDIASLTRMETECKPRGWWK